MSDMMFGTVMSPRPRGVLLKQRSKGEPALCSAILHQGLMVGVVGETQQRLLHNGKSQVC